LVSIVSGIAAIMFVALVPPGRPYDEPAHWANVQWYAHELSMPELGQPGVWYEAQMGPVYYATAAFISRPVEELFGLKAAFYAVRTAGALLVPVAALLTYRLSLLLSPRRGVALGAAIFIGLNPMLLAIGSSIQNDYLAMVIAVGAGIVAVKGLLEGSSSTARAVAVGVLIGLAALTKVFAGGLLLALVVPIVVARPDQRAQRFRSWVVSAVSFSIITSWWFIRNQLIYGDFTARGGLDRVGLSFEPVQFRGIGSLAAEIRSTIADLWIPTEYFRNAFSAPPAVRAAILLLSAVLGLAAVAGVTIRWRRGNFDWTDPRTVSLTTLTSWTVLTFGFVETSIWVWTNYSVRIAFAALPAAVCLIALATGSLHQPQVKRVILVALSCVLAAVSVFSLVQVSKIPEQVFWIRL